MDTIIEKTQEAQLPPNYSIVPNYGKFNVLYCTTCIQHAIMLNGRPRYFFKEEKAQAAAWQHYKSREGIIPDSNHWADFVWPTWVPEKIRLEVERFWDDTFGRSPLAWHKDAVANHAPALGSIARLEHIKPGVHVATEPEHYELCPPGKYVHCWNNIGRIVYPGGVFTYVSCRSDRDVIAVYASL